MLVAWRVCKARFDPFDGTGAEVAGGRWNSPGHPVVYAADSFAGALLEILAHSARPRTLPGPHRGMRFEMPAELVERLEPEQLPGWDERGSIEARSFGDSWLRERRTPVLVVPSVPARPVGRVVLINPRHPSAQHIARLEPFPVPWDDRLF